MVVKFPFVGTIATILAFVLVSYFANKPSTLEQVKEGKFLNIDDVANDVLSELARLQKSKHSTKLPVVKPRTAPARSPKSPNSQADPLSSAPSAAASTPRSALPASVPKAQHAVSAARFPTAAATATAVEPAAVTAIRSSSLIEAAAAVAQDSRMLETLEGGLESLARRRATAAVQRARRAILNEAHIDDLLRRSSSSAAAAAAAAATATTATPPRMPLRLLPHALYYLPAAAARPPVLHHAGVSPAAAAAAPRRVSLQELSKEAVVLGQQLDGVLAVEGQGLRATGRGF